MPKKTLQQLNLILLGDPGAGKATQAEYFCKKYNLYDFDMGKELTLLREKNQQASRELQNNYDLGQLAPTKMARQIIRETFEKLPTTQGILFDGHPKMLGEAKIVASLLKKTSRTKPLVLYIGISMDQMVKRVLGREGYQGTKYKTRHMDTKAGLKNRMRTKRTNIKQVIEYFDSIYTFARIDGMGTRTEVRKRIQKAIDFYQKNYNQIYNI
ncbi:MAG: nucleoside monophosphate kinase [Candidatus Doudnabacteria bacterium]